MSGLGLGLGLGLGKGRWPGLGLGRGLLLAHHLGEQRRGRALLKQKLWHRSSGVPGNCSSSVLAKF